MNKWYMMFGLTVTLMLVAFYMVSTLLEIMATFTGLLGVRLTARENIWGWPIGLISIGCLFFMFLDIKLYADMTLQFFFSILSILGWFIWMTKRGTDKVCPTKRINLSMGIWLGALLIVITAGWGYVLSNYTDASIPYLIAFIATLSLIAQFLLSNKVLESWYCWIVVYIFSVGIYVYKDLHMMAFLYLFYLAIAISGEGSWRRVYQKRMIETASQEMRWTRI